jgi:RsmE family RNA methyltransferase
MKLNRFYTEEILRDIFTLRDSDQIHQIRNVFRAKEGSQVVFFGDGFENIYSIKEISKKEIILKRLERSESKERGLPIHLGIALFKKENFELAVGMATQIGASVVLLKILIVSVFTR